MQALDNNTRPGLLGRNLGTQDEGSQNASSASGRQFGITIIRQTGVAQPLSDEDLFYNAGWARGQTNVFQPVAGVAVPANPINVNKANIAIGVSPAFLADIIGPGGFFNLYNLQPGKTRNLKFIYIVGTAGDAIAWNVQT